MFNVLNCPKNYLIFIKTTVWCFAPFGHFIADLSAMLVEIYKGSTPPPFEVL